MKSIRFGAVYGASPIFCADTDQMGYIDIFDLAIPEELKAQINNWDLVFQKTFNDEYPPDSGFSSDNDVDEHNLQGYKFAQQLQLFLGQGTIVEFFSLENKFKR